MFNIQRRISLAANLLLACFFLLPVLPLKGQAAGHRYQVADKQVSADLATYSTPPYMQEEQFGPVKEIREQLQGSRILVYTKNGEGYVHKNIPNSVEGIKKLGEEHGFSVDVSEDPADFTMDNLQKYDALVFSNTNNDIFSSKKQEEALQRYIRSGGGFVGIHSASGSERDWPWFWSLLGGKFYRHAEYQEFTTKIADKTHPSTTSLPEDWVREDECYYLKQLNPNINVLLYADLTTVEDDQKTQYPGEVFGDKFPLAWYHEYEGGRSWYTALGHSVESYDDPVFMRHILGGIQWVVTGSKATNQD